MTHNGKPVRIEYAPFPAALRDAVKGISSADPSGYFILIDSTRGAQQRRHTLGHELAHVYLNHLEGAGTALADAEREARANAWRFYRLYKQGLL